MVIKYKTYGATGITIGANGAVAITGTMLGMTEYPTGYAPIGLVGYDLGANNYLTTRYIAPRQLNNSTVMIIANQTSAAVTGNVSITIAYAPAAIVGSL